MAKTLYEVLGVPPGSNASEIRSAYRKLVLKHHPDHSSDPKSKEILDAVVSAYEVLSDKSRRRAYDGSLEFEQERQSARRREAAASEAREQASEERAAANAGAIRTAARKAITEDLIRLAKLFNTARYDDAELLAVNILSRSRNEPIPYSILGDIARARGNLNAAVNYYAQALQCDPDNPVYQRQYDELLRRTPADPNAVRGAGMGAGAAMLGIGACVFASIYIVLSNESPLAVGVSLVSTWTLGLVAMLFLSGICVGVALCIGGKLDQFNAVSSTSRGKVSTAMALGTIAIVNFWVAAALYVILGASQNGFNYSTSRVVGCVAAVVALASLSAHFSASMISPIQVLAWGGNLTYIGAICGWMVTDSLRG